MDNIQEQEQEQDIKLNQNNKSKYLDKVDIEDLKPFVYLDPSTNGCYTCTNKQVCTKLQVINKPYGEICSEYKKEE